MRSPRPSLVLSSLVLGTAIVLASTAGAVAGSLVTGAQIKDNTVSSRDIKNKTIALKDLSPAAVGALRGAAGSAGPQGPAGVAGVSGYQMVEATSSAVASGAEASVSATCPAGKRIVGATAYWELSDSAVQIFPGGGSSTTTWVARDDNPGSSTDKIAFRVVCLNAS